LIRTTDAGVDGGRALIAAIAGTAIASPRGMLGDSQEQAIAKRRRSPLTRASLSPNQPGEMMNPLMRKLAPTATHQIRTDHTHVLSIFHQYETDTAPQTKKALVNSACLSLEIHSQLEEEIFYPAMRQAMAEGGTVDKAVGEHQEMHR